MRKCKLKREEGPNKTCSAPAFSDLEEMEKLKKRKKLRKQEKNQRKLSQGITSWVMCCLRDSDEKKEVVIAFGNMMIVGDLDVQLWGLEAKLEQVQD